MKVIKDDFGISHRIVGWDVNRILPACRVNTDQPIRRGKAKKGTVDCMTCLGEEILIDNGHLVLAILKRKVRQCEFADPHTSHYPNPRQGTLEDITCRACRRFACLE